MMKKRFFFLFMLLCLCLGSPLAAQEVETPMTAFLAANNAVPCEEFADFSCVTLQVTLDHFNDTGETIDWVVGVLPASNPEERRGMFVTSVGGPGVSGLSVMEWYSSYFYPEVFEHFDIVFFDQRGIGRSEGVRCDAEALAYYLTNPNDREAVLDAAEQFTNDCIAAIDRPDLLPYLGTTQAVEDLEDFRAAVGDDQFWLYGESYGTQFTQTYAERYSDHLAGMILDGVVDLTLTSPEYYVGQDVAFFNALESSLRACMFDPDCVDDFPDGDPYAYYFGLQEQLANAPIEVDFTTSAGTTEARELTAAMLDSAVTAAAYGEPDRGLLLSGLAAAANGDYLPLLEQAYDSLAMDYDTLEAVPDPSWSDGSFYAIECSDYVYSISNSDPICYFWNQAVPSAVAERPAPLTVDVPTLILNSTLDPATPITNAFAVASRLPNAAMVTTTGGYHVMYGRGGTCPDDQVTAFLVDGSLPEQHHTICAGSVYTDYVPFGTGE
jgi:pimeloyl-ACP methyl ester carboxylesterase